MTLKEFLKRLGRGFKTLGEGIVRTLIFWWFLAGAIFTALFLIHPGPLAHESIRKLFEILATATITGGVFETIIKSFQYSGLFKEELQGIFASDKYKLDQMALLGEVVNSEPERKAQEAMFSSALKSPEFLNNQRRIVSEVVTDPTFLKTQEEKISEIVANTVLKPAFLEQRKDIEEIWKQVTEILYKTRFRDISERIAKKVLDEYFPVGDNFYYDEFREDVEITFCDSAKVFIQSKEKISFAIKPIDETQKVKWGYATSVLKVPIDTTSAVELLKLEVNGVDRKGECRAANPSMDAKCLSLQFDVELAGARKYEVVMEMIRVYDPAVDNVRVFVSSRFVNNPELRIKFPEELNLKFQTVGTRADAYKDKSNFANLIWNVYEDLIFPNQGYRITFSRS